MVKVGIVGFGKMGQTRAEAVKADGRGEVVSVFEPEDYQLPEGAERACSAEAVLTDERIGAVFICTPNFLNQPLTIAALEARKHVFCEKPPAFNAEQMVEVQALERRSGKRLMYGFNHRHHSSIQHMKTLIDAGEYGRVLWMRGRYGKSVDKEFFDGWRANKALAGGGILLDQGIHMVDLFLYLGGTFDEVHAFVSSLYWKRDIEDNVFAIFRNSETGLAASLHSTMTQWRHLFALEVFLERGYFVLNGLQTSTGSYGDEILTIAKNRTAAPAATWEDEEKITYHTNTSWRSEVDAFFRAIEEDRPVEIGTSENALELMRTIDKVYANG